jgi:hypothetical protein
MMDRYIFDEDTNSCKCTCSMERDLSGNWVKYDDAQAGGGGEMNYATDIDQLTASTHTGCQHGHGWEHTIKFLCFKRVYIVCSLCADLIPKTKWKINWY